MAYCTRQTTNTLRNHQHSNLSLPSPPPFPSPSLPSPPLLLLPLLLPLPSSQHSHEGQRTVALHISFTHTITCLCTLNLQHGRGWEGRRGKGSQIQERGGNACARCMHTSKNVSAGSCREKSLDTCRSVGVMLPSEGGGRGSSEMLAMIVGRRGTW